MRRKRVVGMGKAVLSAEKMLSDVKADPLRWFRCSSQAQADFIRALSGFVQVYLRAGNQAGKTFIGAVCGVALARGMAELDGIPLPMLGAPNVGLILAKGREQAKESVLKAYLQAIGEWPHHVEKTGNVVSALWVKPNRSQSDRWQDWSKIAVFVEGGQSLEGMRLDWVHADEPPTEEDWSTLNTRGRPNRHYVRFITATPLYRKEWWWLRKYFQGCSWPKGDHGRVELTLTVYDNKALGPEHIAQMERDLANDPLRDARLKGEYMNIDGLCPFDSKGLNLWLSRCYEGKKHRFDADGLIEYEAWVEPEELADWEGCLIVTDLSAGIYDPEGLHDPACTWVVSRAQPRLLARYNGYLPPYRMGKLSRHLAERYGARRSLIVWENNAGYGEAFYLGLDRGRGLQVYIEHHPNVRGLPMQQRLGWTTTNTTRGSLIGALQQAILEDGLWVESREACESLADVAMDSGGRIEAKAGAHDEDMICGGLAALLLETMPFRPVQRSAESRVRDMLGMRPVQRESLYDPAD